MIIYYGVWHEFDDESGSGTDYDQFLTLNELTEFISTLPFKWWLDISVGPGYCELTPAG